MANNDIIVSEMTPASQINTGDLMIMTQPDAQSETGYSTKSGTVLQVSNKMLKGTNYETDLPSFTNKNVLGGMEELKGDIFNLLPVDETSGSIANFETELAAPLQSVIVNVVATQPSGTPTPSPSTPLPITGYTSANITRCGVNLWDEEWELGEINSSGVLVPDSSHLASSNYIRVAPNTNYRLVGIRAQVAEYDAQKNFIGIVNNGYIGSNGGNVEFTTSATTMFLRFNGASSYGTTYNNDISINYPSTYTTYHAYNGQTYAIAFGQTVYGGVLDVTRGKLHVTWAELNSLGSLNWGGSNGKFYSTSLASVIKKGTTGDFDHVMCSIFEAANVGSLGSLNNYQMSVDTSGNIQIRDDDYTNNTLFANAMIDVKLYYELATPFDIDLTPEVISALALPDSNNVFADCGSITVRFKDTIQHYIDKKIAQTQALIL